MNNLKNKIIVLAKLLGIFVLGIMILSPVQANAYVTRGSYPYWNNGNYIMLPTNSNNIAPIPNNPVPVIYSLSPDNITDKNSGEIRIKGARFVRTSTARLNGSDRPTTYLNSTHLVMKLTTEDLKHPGDYLITVFNPAPQGGISNTEFFTIRQTPNTALTNTTSKNTTKATTKDATFNSDTADNQKNNLDANVSSSGISFLPNTIFEWILLFILILLGMFIGRKIYLKKKKKNKMVLKPV